VAKSDRRLIGECLAGSDDAFGALFDRHNQALYGFARHLSGSDSDGEDLCQSAWLEAIRSTNSFRGRGSFRAWLHGIALNLHRDGLRRPRLDLVALDPEQRDPHGDPQRAAEGAEVRAALLHLEAEHREVLILHELQGFKYREIAQIVGCPIGTVKSRLHYAVAALRNVLGAERSAQGGRP